jgi:Leucine-rich repeat (LRR) protein
MLNDNQLQGLPEGMRKLTKLKQLALNNNQLHQLPQELLIMAALKNCR